MSDNINPTSQVEPNESPDTDTYAEKTRITTSMVSVEVLGFSEPIEGKIDTGAAQSCLHATEINVENGQVSFVFGENRYRTAVHQTQDVSSADGGVSSRPVVLLNLTVAGKNLPEVPVNLNDRTDMPQKFLIGQDIIKAADFIIDLSDEPTDSPEQEAGAEPKPEQEEVSNAIAQLGDNPLAHQEQPTSTETEQEASLASIRQQLTDLLAMVDKLIQNNS